jgi:hypothetical protein
MLPPANPIINKAISGDVEQVKVRFVDTFVEKNIPVASLRINRQKQILSKKSTLTDF